MRISGAYLDAVTDDQMEASTDDRAPGGSSERPGIMGFLRIMRVPVLSMLLMGTFFAARLSAVTLAETGGGIGAFAVVGLAASLLLLLTLTGLHNERPKDSFSLVAVDSSRINHYPGTHARS